MPFTSQDCGFSDPTDFFTNLLIALRVRMSHMYGSRINVQKYTLTGVSSHDERVLESYIYIGQYYDNRRST